MQLRQIAMLALSVDFDKKYKSFCSKREPPTEPPGLPISKLTTLIEAKGKSPIHFKREEVLKFFDHVKIGSPCVSSYGTDITFFENRFRQGELTVFIYPGFELVGPVKRDYAGGSVGLIASFAHALRNGREERVDADFVDVTLYFSNEEDLQEGFEFVFGLYEEVKPLLMKALEDELVERNNPGGSDGSHEKAIK